MFDLNLIQKFYSSLDSKVKLILINNNLDLIKYVKQNIYGNKIVIGMGAGSISNWIRDLPKHIK